LRVNAKPQLPSILLDRPDPLEKLEEDRSTPKEAGINIKGFNKSLAARTHRAARRVRDQAARLATTITQTINTLPFRRQFQVTEGQYGFVHFFFLLSLR
jgi:hypothetical protein